MPGGIAAELLEKNGKIGFLGADRYPVQGAFSLNVIALSAHLHGDGCGVGTLDIRTDAVVPCKI